MENTDFKTGWTIKAWVGEINHKQYRDSVYTDFENYMIKK